MAAVPVTTGRIAAVITCHNLGRTLVEALESVERQTRPAAEIVVVDGASSDPYTRQILMRLQREGTCVVRTATPGASAARNCGATATTSEYVVCLDADDVLEPGYFAAAGARLDAEPDLDFVSCAMQAFGEAAYIWRPSAATFVEAVSTGGVPHASTMARRELWNRIGGFDEDVVSFELLDFWASALERGCQGIVLEEPFLRYRVRSGSGYRRSIRPETYLARLTHFYGKHRGAVERHGLALIERKEAFFLDQREYGRNLEARRNALASELDALRQQVAETVRQLESRGLSRVEWGDLKRSQPISPFWGWDRGKPVDRHYIEAFLERHRHDVRGRVLEVRDSVYTRRYGGAAVRESAVLDIDPANRDATVVADLRRASAIPSDRYDCIILTQTLQLIDDVPAVLDECARMLRPGGALLVTVPTIIRVDDEGGLDGDFWRLTEASARKLFAGTFPLDAFEVTSYGNVMAAAAFLYGLSTDEISTADLDRFDSDFPLIVAVRAVKPAEGVKTADLASGADLKTCATRVQGASPTAAILAYHRIAELTPDSHGLCTPPDVFREHMRCLAQDFVPIALDDLVRAAASGRIPERAVAVTLDDGYLDALTVASPILAELGVPATFFVNTDRLDEEHERWWDILERVLSIEAEVPPLLQLTVGGESLRLPTGTREQRADTLTRLNAAAWPLDAAAREELAARVLAWSGADRAVRPTHRVLTGGEIRALAGRPGHSIGAHTGHHLALTTQPAETKRREIADHKTTLERLLQRPAHLFSYPYGDFDAETVTIAGAAGFRAAVTVEPGLVSAGTNRLLLPRHEIGARHHRDFLLHLREVFDGCLLSR